MKNLPARLIDALFIFGIISSLATIVMCSIVLIESNRQLKAIDAQFQEYQAAIEKRDVEFTVTRYTLFHRQTSVGKMLLTTMVDDKGEYLSTNVGCLQ
jgi:hypothetical protein